MKKLLGGGLGLALCLAVSSLVSAGDDTSPGQQAQQPSEQQQYEMGKQQVGQQPDDQRLRRQQHLRQLQDSRHQQLLNELRRWKQEQ